MNKKFRDQFLFGKDKYKKKMVCIDCKYQKKGLTTVCEKYRRILDKIQQGDSCEHYKKAEV